MSKNQVPERPSIAEKVQFWEEQDRINQAVIPRLVAMHDRVVELEKAQQNVSSLLATSEARLTARLEERAQNTDSLVEALHARIEALESSRAALERRLQEVSRPEPPRPLVQEDHRQSDPLPLALSVIALVIALAAFVLR